MHVNTTTPTTQTKTTTRNFNNKNNNNNNTEEEVNPAMKLNLKINVVPQSDGESERSVVTDDIDKGPRSPFQREVREWQHIDPDTGALLTKRLEADRWINGPLNKYGKISDSQNVAQPNGTQHTKRKQLEVLKSRTNNGGALQVIRTQTSSRWSSASASPATSATTSPTIITTTEEEIRENGGSGENEGGNTTYIFNNKNNHNNNHHNHYHNNNNNNDIYLKTQQQHDENNTDQTETTSTAYRPWPTSQTTTTASTTTKTTATTNTTNVNAHTKAGADIDAGSNNGLEICEVSDSEAADIVDIDCNGIVVDSDDDVNNNNENHYDNADRDNTHNRDQDCERVFIHKVHIDADYERPRCNEFNDDRHYNNNKNNNNKNQNNMVNNLLETNPSVKLSNLMNSNSSSSMGSNSSGTTSTPRATISRAKSPTKSVLKNVFGERGEGNGKISLSAIVEDYKNSNRRITDDKKTHDKQTSSIAAASTSLTAAKSTKATFPLQKKQTEKLENQEYICSGGSRVFGETGLYGENNNNNNNNNNMNSSSSSSSKNKHNNSIEKNNNKLISVKSRVGANAVTNVNIDGSNSTISVGGEEGFGISTDEFRHCDKPRLQQQQRRQQDEEQQLKKQHRKSHIEAQFTPTREQPQKLKNELESFRLYNNHNNNKNNGIAMSINGKQHVVGDSDLVEELSSRNNIPVYNNNPLQRTHSMSTDDLSTSTNEDTPSEWQRMTKLRRSFQSNTKPEVSTHDITNANSQNSKRSDDLPTYKGSVARIRAELEQGHCFNPSSMRSNYVKNNDSNTEKLVNTKRNSYIAADSLQEIRGKLKRLSDEALYKEESLLKPKETSQPYRSKLADLNEQPPSTKTNSLASRQKYRQSINEDWQSRRKSYGFEKMLPEENKKNIQRMDASTDSGLGRSGDIGNWSPTSESIAAPRSTLVHLGSESPKHDTINGISVRYSRPQKSPFDKELNDNEDEDSLKRHSIAVDETKYVRDKHAPVQLSSLYKQNNDNAKSLNDNNNNNNKTGAGKRVEFCKTEVHFAAESGRVNIVETDGKPPPTHNFRRRRRTTSASGPLESLVNSATTAISKLDTSNSNCLPVTRFGDNEPTAISYVPYKASLIDLPNKIEAAAAAKEAINVIGSNAQQGENYRTSYMSSTSGNETTDNETDELFSLRGILKNKSLKPKPYHLGENIASADALWGLPVVAAVNPNETKMPRTTLSNLKSYDSLPNPTTTSVAERVRLVEKRQELGQTNGYSTRINLNISDNNAQDWSNAGMQNQRPSMHDKLLQDLRQHEQILDEGLKSTSLIIKTMRSASAFDEAMRRLSISSDIMTDPVVTLPVNGYYEKPTINMAHIKTSSITTNFIRKYSTDSCDSLTNTTKLKLGNPSIPISQQLEQLRLMYEMNASQDSEDSADEEVKSYFFDNSDSSDNVTHYSGTKEKDNGSVISGSWSRLKAKRSLQKMHESNQMQYSTCSIHKDIPKSNVMSIELHSPQSTLKKPEGIKFISSAPTAKPRRFFLHQRQAVPTHSHMTQPKEEKRSETKEALKIVKEALGARKLRDHELSYFGIQINNNTEPTNETKTTKVTTTVSDRRALTSHHKRHSIDNDSNITKTNLTMKDEPVKNWQLNDKPDLLNHNPIPINPYANKSFTAIRPAERKSLKSSKPIENDEDHLYENITKELTPVFKIKEPETDFKYNYDRKTDTKRDAQILKEMSYNADHTLKTVTNESALKDQRRRSIRRQSTPLETISEKSIARKVNNTCVAVRVVRNRSPHKNHNSNRSRSSSISSDNSCTRTRTRSLSSERESTTGANKNRDQTDSMNRSQRSTRSFHENRGLNSLESYRRPSTSGDESHTALRVKTKRVCSTCHHGLPDTDIHKSRKNSITDREKSNSSKEKSAVCTTHFSNRERVKCAKDAGQKQSGHRQSERENKSSASSKERRDKSTVTSSSQHKRREEAAVQNSFRKLTSVLGLSKPSVEKKLPTSSQSLESRSVARDKSYESNSRGNSNHISATQSHERRKTSSTRNSSRDKKKVLELTPSDSMTTTKHHRSHGSTDNRSATIISTKVAAKHKRERK